MDVWVASKKCMSSCTPIGALNLQQPEGCVLAYGALQCADIGFEWPWCVTLGLQ